MPPNVAVALYGFIRDVAKENSEFYYLLRNNLPSYITDMYIYTMSEQHERGFTENNMKITIEGLKKIYLGFNVIAHIWEYNEEMFKRLVPNAYKERCDLPGSGRLYRMYSQIFHTCKAIEHVLDNENPDNPYDFIILTRPDTFLYHFSENVFTISEYIPHQPNITPLNDFPDICEANDHCIVLPRAFAEKRALCFRNITRYLNEFFIPNNILPWCEACFAYHDYVYKIPKQLCYDYNACIQHNMQKFKICERIFEKEKQQTKHDDFIILTK